MTLGSALGGSTMVPAGASAGCCQDRSSVSVLVSGCRTDAVSAWVAAASSPLEGVIGALITGSCSAHVSGNADASLNRQFPVSAPVKQTGTSPSPAQVPR